MKGNKIGDKQTYFSGSVTYSFDNAYFVGPADAIQIHICIKLTVTQTC